jgi:hypothetical protein
VKAKQPKVPADLATSSPGSLVDLTFALREHRKTIEAQAELVAVEEKRIIDHLIETCSKEELTKLAGKVAQASLVRTLMPSITDWDKVNEYITTHDAWQLRNKAANAAAFRELWEAGIEVPGVEKFVQLKLNVKKL